MPYAFPDDYDTHYLFSTDDVEVTRVVSVTADKKQQRFNKMSNAEADALPGKKTRGIPLNVPQEGIPGHVLEAFPDPE